MNLNINWGKFMRLHTQIGVTIVLLAGGILMANQSGNCGGVGYKEYSSEDTELNIKMDYIAGWEYREHRGSHGSYAQVQFYGAAQGAVAPSIIVTVEKVSDVDFSPLTVEAMAEDLINKRLKLEDSKVLSRMETTLLDMPAMDITFAYKQKDRLRSLNFNMILFKERVVVVQKGDRFYTLRYVNPEQTYEEFEQDFLHCLRTFTLKE